VAPCIDTPDVPNCAEYLDEVQDILAYRAFLGSAWASPSASAVLVGFHNLVTASIVANPKTEKYLKPDRQRLFCVQEVLRDIPSQFGPDTGTQPLPPSTFDGVPGLAPKHRLLACPA